MDLGGVFGQPCLGWRRTWAGSLLKARNRRASDKVLTRDPTLVADPFRINDIILEEGSSRGHLLIQCSLPIDSRMHHLFDRSFFLVSMKQYASELSFSLGRQVSKMMFLLDSTKIFVVFNLEWRAFWIMDFSEEPKPFIGPGSFWNSRSSTLKKFFISNCKKHSPSC